MWLRQFHSSAKEMKTRFPAYVVAEVPAPISVAVQTIRDNLATPLAKLPVEITLGGSSGFGPIPAGGDLALIRKKLDQLFAGIHPIRAAFSGIEAFPGGSVIYLTLADRGPFDAIHQLLRKLIGICFLAAQPPRWGFYNNRKHYPNHSVDSKTTPADFLLCYGHSR